MRHLTEFATSGIAGACKMRLTGLLHLAHMPAMLEVLVAGAHAGTLFYE
jgi:hypothetical protein